MSDATWRGLRGPTPWRQLPTWPARGLLAVLLLLVGYGVRAGAGGALLAGRDVAERNPDSALYEAVDRRVRAGESYYTAAGAELRQRGYPTRSVFNWRLPTLAWIFGLLPSQRTGRLLLTAISALTVLVWFRLGVRLTSPGLAIAAVALLSGLLLWPVVTDAYLVHETWAGIGIALSVGAMALGWRGLGVAAGLSALLVRELALPYVCLSLLLAARERRPREAWLWLAGLLAFGVALAAHALLVSHHLQPGDRAQQVSWLQFGGWRFVLKTGLANLWLIAAPGAVTALIWPIALLGLPGWPGPLRVRLAGTAFLYVAAFLVAGLSYNYLWGLLYAGLVPLGLPFAPAALRDLWHTATRRAAPAA